MNRTKSKTTYGVYNMIEWYALMRMGKATVKVPFTGGSITPQGVTPATYTTSDPVIQFAIERSPDYLSGKIKVIRRVDLKEAIEVERNAPKSLTSDFAPVELNVSKADPAGDQSAAVNHMPETNVDDSECDSGPADEIVTTQVEFSCNDDAKDYLEQNFGFIRSKLKNRDEIIAAGKSKGIEIIFI